VRSARLSRERIYITLFFQFYYVTLTRPPFAFSPAACHVPKGDSFPRLAHYPYVLLDGELQIELPALHPLIFLSSRAIRINLHSDRHADDHRRATRVDPRRGTVSSSSVSPRTCDRVTETETAGCRETSCQTVVATRGTLRDRLFLLSQSAEAVVCIETGMIPAAREPTTRS